MLWHLPPKERRSWWLAAIPSGKAVVEEMRRAGGTGGVPIAAYLDGSPESFTKLLPPAKRLQTLGGIVDVLVSNAGIYPKAATAETDEATFDEVYAVNVKASNT